MKHGIIIPFYNNTLVSKINMLVELAPQLENTCFCFVSDGNVSRIKEAIANFGHLTDKIYFINVSSATKKEDAVKKAAIFLFKKTRVASIGFIDPEYATSFSDYRVLADTYGETEESILTSLKKINVHDKYFASHITRTFIL